VVEFTRKAQTLLDYYHRVAVAQPEQWGTPLRVAQRWHDLVQSAEVPPFERRRFLAEVEGINQDFGTAWSELKYWIAKWAESA